MTGTIAVPLTEMNLSPEHTGAPKAHLALIPSGGKEVSQESLKLPKVQYPHLRRCWRGLLELKVNLMQLIITDNYVLNSTTLGLIIYQM